MTKSRNTQKRPPLRAIGFDAFLDKDIAPLEPILSPVIVEKSANMIYAYRGVGKTHLTHGMAIAMSSGGEILGLRAPRPRKVLIIDGEMSAFSLQQRFKQALKAPGIIRPRRRYLRLLSADMQSRGIPDLSTLEGQRAVNDVIEDEDVIILDNLSTLCRSGKENEAESWTSVLEWTQGLQRDGRAVLFVHHAGKNGTQRGTSRREDMLHTVISLRRPNDYSPSDGARFEVHIEKGRDIMGKDAEPFEARLTERGWTRATIGNPLTDQILELNDQGLSRREIARRVGVSHPTVHRIIDKSRRAP